MNLVDRVKNIMLTPKTEWTAVHAEKMSVQEIYVQYLVLLAALPAAGQLLSLGRLGGFNIALRMAIISYIASLVGAYVTSLVVDNLANSFASTRNMNNAFKLVAYGMTPSLIAGLLVFLPSIGALAALAGAIYGIYLFYLGLPVLMNTPQDRVVPYMIVSFLALLVVYFILGWILAVFLGVSFLRY